ncbi:hypothetical protein BU24DRAFT_478323 [Aaosphaeria arxii CBS 175.79]|uniref:Zn(2)-C6 fungal-type domain-containing protein n=1 Tax=Aaosphaeria arxii CBS 175.79 TaxID=1450172 RepID=A0A6A5XVK0_9PLEO|nr:uncharacterized protein BU24DRAFT_478323 [Aaosphaeria arxii CBS 175.79]KAF2017242.1 hypothetical protein BU24DRAFT_478323 [Aaosphaeria arxii CBS 175.79]
MAETVTVPSPSLFLSSPNPGLPSPPPLKKTSIHRSSQQQPSTKTDDPKVADPNGANVSVTKRKQSKSRNGCITCKAKRLKCDETKPTCQQCARRNVQCGGYKKDFKWRSFEEGNFTGKPTTKTKKGFPASPQPATAPLPAYNPGFTQSHYPPSHSEAPLMYFFPPTQTYFDAPYQPMTTEPYPIPQVPQYTIAPPPVTPLEQYAPSSVESSSNSYEADSIGTSQTKTVAASSVSSGQSPRLVDLLLPGTDLTVPPEEYFSFRSLCPESFYQSSGYTPPTETIDDDIEEIPRNFDLTPEQWTLRRSSASPPDSSASSPESGKLTLLTQPVLSMSSPEMLIRRFDLNTCGVLSVKDGPTENPWRTLVWPLAKDCPALFHAVASMTSFHCSKDSPMLRIHGINHMHESVHALRANLGNMRVDAAISTTLALAFSESWDQHIRTGINHIKGAKILIHRALSDRSHLPQRGEDFDRLKFLCNLWIYMDVIARLTSADEDESNDFDFVSDAIYSNGGNDSSVDPLMGCASSLFPIIGRIANLVRKVRRTGSNGPSIISQAIELKAQIEKWTPPAFIEDPEDESTTPHDTMRTAAAYQYATLLYLHQAVPEVPSLPATELAKRALCELATVNIKSRSVIVHIFPLIAAGCEMTEPEDRRWVQERWELLSARMKLGIVERCLEITKEVWSRRDAFAASAYDELNPLSTPTLKRDFDEFTDDAEESGLVCWPNVNNKRRAAEDLMGFPQTQPVKLDTTEVRHRSESRTEILHPDMTVKGRLHWLGVMKGWGWEGKEILASLLLRYHSDHVQYC